ncbi:hypothetical protein V3H18_04215 [Methylocystis sp. 9N]|uniref:DUF1190 domain-containing protein n=1 Tax=Methylocystis borbori TaxID=3118750 RepID=A0ABU7XEC6_9HYPH
MFKYLLIAIALVAAGVATFYGLRRSPVCASGGKYMATLSDCASWGVDAGICKEASERARAIVAQAAPKTETLFQCEVRFTDCFEAPGGGFSPRPSFCLRPDKGAEPFEVRYLEYESDRMNRKKTKEMRVN